LLDFSAAGIDLGDPGLNAVLGQALSGRADLAWTEGAALVLNAVDLFGMDYGLALSGQVSEPARGLAYTGDVQARFDDLARLQPLLGRPLSGAAEMNVSGRAELLAGGFDLEIAAAGDAIRTGDPQLDRLLGAEIAFGASALRDVDGLALRDFDLQAAGLEATGSATLTGPGSDLFADGTVQLVIDDLGGLSGVLGRALAGRLTADVSGSAALDVSRFDISAEAATIGLRTGDADLDRLLAGDGRVTLAAARDNGGATLRNLDARFPGVTAQATGQALGTMDALDTTLDATVQIDDLSGLRGLVGRDLAGSVDARVAGEAMIDATRPDPLAILAGGKLAFDADLTARNLSLGDAALDRIAGGDAAVTLKAAREDETLTLEVFDMTLSAATATAQGTATGPLEALRIDATAKLGIPDLSPFGGLLDRSLAGTLNADVTADLLIDALGFDPSVTLDADRFALTADIATAGLATGDADLDRMLGGDGQLTVQAERDGDGIALRRLDARYAGLTAAGTGRLGGPADARVAAADLTARVPDLSVLNGLTGQSLAGAIDATVKGQAGLDGQTFDLTADLTTTRLRTGIAQAGFSGGR
jgi:hypothetical protein